jgi:hypothetical protein
MDDSIDAGHRSLHRRRIAEIGGDESLAWRELVDQRAITKSQLGIDTAQQHA